MSYLVSLLGEVVSWIFSRCPAMMTLSSRIMLLTLTGSWHAALRAAAVVLDDSKVCKVMQQGLRSRMVHEERAARAL